MYDLCKTAGMPDPEFDFVPNYVCLTIRFKKPLMPYVGGDVNGPVNGPVNGDVNGPVNGLSDSLKEVYYIVLKNPGIKNKQVADLRSKPASTVKKQLTVLRKNGLIEYRGSDKTGGYYPVKS